MALLYEHGRLLQRGKPSMGFWSNLRNSIHKASELRRISRTLGQFATTRGSSANFSNRAIASMAATDEMKEAEEALFNLIEDDETLSDIMRSHAASRDDLHNLYSALFVEAGQWQRGHWVPASALAFGLSLDYLLAECVSGTRSQDQKINALFVVRNYFKEGRVGPILERRIRLRKIFAQSKKAFGCSAPSKWK
jgi:hypothetical protein